MPSLLFFFFEWSGDHRDLHRVDRRQRQMCIRDRMCQGKIDDVFIQDRPSVSGEQMVCFEKSFFKFICCPVSLLPWRLFLRSAARNLSLPCLLYTSDAADDLLCVDLGGCRINKKKKNDELHCVAHSGKQKNEKKETQRRVKESTKRRTKQDEET